MKTYVLPGLLVLGMALTISCKKKKNSQDEAPENPATPAVTETNPSYSQLKAGNYWIYEYYMVDPNGASPLGQYDSAFVSTDTLIHGHTFFKFHSFSALTNHYETSYLRDSLHYLVTSAGRVLFSSEDFSSVFYTDYMISYPDQDTLYKINSQMGDKDLIVQVGAGSFVTSSMQRVYNAYPVFQHPGVPNPRYLNARYAKNVGLVSQTETFYSGVNSSKEKRLIRYHLE